MGKIIRRTDEVIAVNAPSLVLADEEREALAELLAELLLEAIAPAVPAEAER